MDRAAISRFLAVCAGGAVGTGIRYVTNLQLPRITGASFPWPTLTVNVVGSFLLGLVATLALRKILSDDWRAVLGTGVMGGLTTYSTFNLETIQLVQEKAPREAALYLLVTLVTCVCAGLLGMAAGGFGRPA